MTAIWPQPRISRTFSTRSPRSILKPPDRPIALRPDYITDTKTTIVVWPRGNSASADAYRISDDDGIPLFTATGRRFNSGRGREFRDASGLPLFEVKRNWLSWRSGWVITLPGCSSTPTNSSSPSTSRSSGDSGKDIDKAGLLATGTPRIRTLTSTPIGNFSITIVQNAGATATKRSEDKKLTLEIERHGNALAFFDVVDVDRKVAEVRESIRYNERLALISSQSGYRPVFEVIVTAGVDLSLVSFVSFSFWGMLVVADWLDCGDCGDCVRCSLQRQYMIKTFN